MFLNLNQVLKSNKWHTKRVLSHRQARVFSLKIIQKKRDEIEHRVAVSPNLRRTLL